MQADTGPHQIACRCSWLAALRDLLAAVAGSGLGHIVEAERARAAIAMVLP